METYISVPLATMGIGLLLSVLTLYLCTRASEKVRPAIWFFAVFSIVVNGAGIYYLFSSPNIATLITLWILGTFATAFAQYPLLRPYLVHGIYSPTPLLESCVILFWPLAALGGYALYVVCRSYSFGPKEKLPDEVAPTTWEKVRDKKEEEEKVEK